MIEAEVKRQPIWPMALRITVPFAFLTLAILCAVWAFGADSGVIVLKPGEARTIVCMGCTLNIQPVYSNQALVVGSGVKAKEESKEKQ